MTEIIAVTIGDIKGIGIKILIDSWKRNKIKNFILFSDKNFIKKYIRDNKLNIDLNIINSKDIKYNKKKLNIFSYKSKSFEDNTYKSLIYAYDFCIKKLCIGTITLPLRKDLIRKKIDKSFIGHTEFFQNLNKKKQSNMILYHKKIIISPLTTHLEIKKISRIISSKNYIFEKILNLHNSLKKDFNIKKPKIIISGLNPHAGENGEIGIEEKKYIKPIISKLQNKGIKIIGPVSADSMLIKKNILSFNCFVFMYHDQALIPFKYISQFSGVNYTGNLDIIRTSPDHGTAYNLINSNEISDKSLINCFRLIKKIFQNRIIDAKSKKIS